MTAHEEGEAANLAGVKARKCPYPDAPRRSAWERGRYEVEIERGPYCARAIVPGGMPKG